MQMLGVILTAIMKNICVLGFIIGICQSTIMAKNLDQNYLQKPQILSVGSFDGNRIHADMENNGMLVSHRITGHSGLEWPQGNSSYTVYAAGLWFAGKVNGEIRTAVAEYGPEFTPGPWGSGGEGASYRLYKVNIDDLVDPELNPDFAAWPVQQGAPWIDADNDGIYSPMPSGPDQPEFIGDQVIFYVMNDGEQDEHSIFNTEPLGIEVRMTIWGYESNTPWGDMMFVKAQVYNKGGNEIEALHFGQWSDPDVGNAGDDWVGCDIDRSLGYAYNDGADNTFGYKAPALGFDFLQIAVPSTDTTAGQYCFGAIQTRFKNLPMTSFMKFDCGGDVYVDPNDEAEAYNYLSGWLRDGSPIINPVTGLWTKYVNPGDPNLNINNADAIWVDSDDPGGCGDKRMLMGSGPFTLHAGDSAEIVIALLHAQGTNAKNSVTLLKYKSDKVQALYERHFSSAELPPVPNMTATASSDEIILEWEDNAESYITSGDQTYTFEGYNIYQHERLDTSSTRLLLATFDLKNGVTQIWDNVIDSELGEVIYQPVQFGTDSGIQRFLSIRRDAINSNMSLIDDREYYFSVTSYVYNGFLAPVTLESNSPIHAIRPQTNVYINPGMDHESEILVTHEGLADADVTVKVVNPYDLSGADYTIFFDQQHYYKRDDGTWTTIADTTEIAIIDPEFMTIKHWNLKNSAGSVLIGDNTTLAGTQFEYIDSDGIYHPAASVGNVSNPVIHGFQVEVHGSYTDPINFASVALTENPLGATTLSSRSNTANLDIQNYTIFGGTVSSYAMDNFGVGTTSINELQEDLELRFTGVLDTNIVNGQTLITVSSGGSMATMMQNQDGFAVHPLGGGASSEFMLRIPFEVWNIDKRIQVNLAFRDRVQAATAEPYYAWNLVNRMYAVVVNTPYDAVTPISGIWDGVSNPLNELATWVLVFYGTNYHVGDVVTITYDNPLQQGVDSFEFTTIAPATKTFDPTNIKVWPNPFMGRNPEQSRTYDYRIHFINLPELATIKIYSLAGQLLRIIEHDGSQEALWDCRNYENGLVASGMYIAVVSSDEGDKVLKLAIVLP